MKNLSETPQPFEQNLAGKSLLVHILKCI